MIRYAAYALAATYQNCAADETGTAARAVCRGGFLPSSTRAPQLHARIVQLFRIGLFPASGDAERNTPGKQAVRLAERQRPVGYRNGICLPVSFAVTSGLLGKKVEIRIGCSREELSGVGILFPPLYTECRALAVY